MSVHRTKLFEIISANTADSKSYIFSGYFTHITLEKLSKE
jgi:hypothetical protein